MNLFAIWQVQNTKNLKALRAPAVAEAKAQVAAMMAAKKAGAK